MSISERMKNIIKSNLNTLQLFIQIYMIHYIIDTAYKSIEEVKVYAANHC